MQQSTTGTIQRRYYSILGGHKLCYETKILQSRAALCLAERGDDVLCLINVFERSVNLFLHAISSLVKLTVLLRPEGPSGHREMSRCSRCAAHHWVLEGTLCIKWNILYCLERRSLQMIREGVSMLPILFPLAEETLYHMLWRWRRKCNPIIHSCTRTDTRKYKKTRTALLFLWHDWEQMWILTCSSELQIIPTTWIKTNFKKTRKEVALQQQCWISPSLEE